MAFVVPTFPLTVNIWRNAAFGGPPSLTSPGNLAMGHRSYPSLSQAALPAFSPILLLPKLTDVRTNRKGGLSDFVEVPAGSGRTYVVEDVEDVGKGFPNEFRVAVLMARTGWPVPYP